MQSRLPRTIGLAVLATLLVLGAGWILEKATSSPQSLGAPTISEPAKPSTTVKPAPTDQENDRSDLVLSLG